MFTNAGDGADDGETESESDAGENKSEDSDVAASAKPTTPAPASFEGRDAAEVISEALAPVHPHLSPYAANMLPGLLAPLATAATAAPRVIVQSAPSAGASVPPVVNVAGFDTARNVFGFGKRIAESAKWSHALDHTRLAVCDYAGADKVDPFYAWDPGIAAQLAAADAAGLCAWLYGPAGVGKTEGVEQYAARLKRPFVRIAISKEMEGVEVIGQQVLAKDGGMQWKDGALAAAFRIPYCVILLDEPSTNQRLSTIFQTALDKRRLFLNGGAEILYAAQGVFICAADNTAGCGEDSGRYVGTEAMNAALLDRFAIKLQFTHMPPDREAGMLSSRTGLHRDACALIVAYATTTRNNATSGNLSMGITPRRLLSWATMVRQGIPSETAFVSTIINGCAPEDKETLLQLQETSLKSEHATIDALARGVAVPVPAMPASEPAPISPAGAVFPAN